MGKCPNCGNSGLFLKTKKCKICGKEGCEKCLTLLFEIYDHVHSDSDSTDERTLDKWYTCSDDCLTRFADCTTRFIPEQCITYSNWNAGFNKALEELILKPPVEKWVDNDLAKKESVKHSSDVRNIRIAVMGWESVSVIERK